MQPVRILRARAGIDDGSEAGEAAGGHIRGAVLARGWHRGCRNRGAVCRVALIGEVEEELVLEDGTADASAVLVPAQGILLAGRREVVERVKGIVLDELEGRAVEAVGAALEQHVETGHAAAVLRAEVGGLHVHFADGVDGRIVVAGVGVARLRCA